MELAKHLEMRDRHGIINTLIGQASFQRASSDARFDLAMEKLRAAAETGEADQNVIRNRAGVPIIRSERTSTTLRLTVDLKAAPGLDEYLLDRLPGILAGFDQERI